jgi:carbonic anhydrase
MPLPSLAAWCASSLLPLLGFARSTATQARNAACAPCWSLQVLQSGMAHWHYRQFLCGAKQSLLGSERNFMQCKLLTGLMVLAFGFSAHANELWSYEGSGAPENWGKLSQEFQICEKGFNQSPIDIQRTVNGKLPVLDINIHVKNQEIINNGHSIQINVANDDDFSIDGKDYNLKQFHFHSPSENKIKGKEFPLEIHFVHAMEEDGNRLAVLAVMVEEGKPNPAIAEILKSLPKEKNKAEALNTTINISSLYPKSRHYYLSHPGRLHR